MANRGRLLALDTSGKKLEELRRRARRAGLSTVAARPIEGGRLPDEARPAGWDRVLVDSPCSGLGTLRRNPEARWRLDPRTVERFPAQQLALLVTYAPLVAPGGRLIYVTCSLLAEENEDRVAAFLQRHRDFSIGEIPAGLPLRRLTPEGYLRLTPLSTETDPNRFK